jgi:hypothetical protein
MNYYNKVIEHLKLIQGIITRMSTSSFNIKGFILILFSSFIAYGLKEKVLVLFYIVYLIIILLSFLDCFYLWQEKLYRKLYDNIRLKGKMEILQQI